MAIYLKIDGIDGESTDDKHRGWIEVFSFSWGLSQTGEAAHGTGGGAGKVSFSDLNVVKKLDSTSPRLMLACASGKHFPAAQLVITSDSRKAAALSLKLGAVAGLKMNDVLVTSFQNGGSSGEVPTESLSLNFSTVDFATVSVDPETGQTNGPSEVLWDLRTNQGG
jgi:type VI secretion system secreted protein Hcp